VIALHNLINNKLANKEAEKKESKKEEVKDKKGRSASFLGLPPVLHVDLTVKQCCGTVWFFFYGSGSDF
jgi:hypothetical protein